MEPFTRPEDAQQFVLQKAYAHFRDSGQWPQARGFDVAYGDLLDPMGGLALLTRQLGSDKVTPVNPENANDSVMVRLRGLGEVPEAREDIENFLATVRLAARRYRETEGQQATITVGDLIAAEAIEERAAKRAIQLFGWASVVNTGGGPDQWGVAHAIRRFTDVRDLDDFLARADAEDARRLAVAEFRTKQERALAKPGTLRPLPRHSPEDPALARVLSSADEPIASSADDLLGRAPFADAIARAISSWTGTRSLVLAILGAWGTGKSSVKNMVREQLATVAERRLHVLDFNPWQWSGSDQLAAGFFRDVGVALGITDRHHRNERLAKLWTKYAATLQAGALLGQGMGAFARFVWVGATVLAFASAVVPPTWLRLFLMGLAVLGIVGGAALKHGGRAAQAIASVFRAGSEVAERTLEELKADLASELTKREQHLVVIIDDIDRLSADEIPLLFQLVKANADFPNVVYLLLFQRDIVEKALEQAAPGGDARGYLDKIVQVSFTLGPVERSRLEAVLGAGLDAALTTDEEVRRRFNQHRWQNLFLTTLRPYFSTLRDVRRFLNTLAFHVSVFRGPTAFEVNPVDLVALEVLRVFEPDLYDALPAAKELLTGDQPTTHLEGKERVEAVRAEIMGLVRRGKSTRHAEIRGLIKELFPRTAWAFDRVDAPTVSEEWFRDLRVGHPDVVDRYFLFATPEGDISEAELQHLISITHSHEMLAAELLRLNTRKLLPAALDRLDSYKEQIPVGSAVPLATALFDVGDDLSDDEPGGSFLIPAALSPGRIIKWNLLQESDPQKRAVLLEQAIKATRGLFLPVRQVALETRDGSSAGKKVTWLLEESDVPRMQALCVERLAAAATDGSLDHQPHLAYLLYRWKEWAGPAEPRAYVEKLVGTAVGLLTFLRGFMHDLRHGGPSELVPRTILYLRVSELETFVPLDLLETKVTALESTPLEQADSDVVRAFWAAVRRKREGRPEDDV